MQIEDSKNSGSEAGNKRGDLAGRLMDFAVSVVKSGKNLSDNYPGMHISNQLMRSATSAGANYEEACGAESRPDFIHKMQIVLKELKEARYWIRLAFKLELLHPDTFSSLSKEADELANMVAKSVITAKGAVH